MKRTKGLSGKELEMVSYLELEEMSFFTRKNIKKFFKNNNELNVYIHRLRKKGRIIKINKSKYYLIPVKAYKGKWSEHPFIIVNEIFNGKGYCIGGKSAAYYWGFVEQIPTEIDVFSRTRQGKKRIFDVIINFRRVRKQPDCKKIKISKYSILMATKNEAYKWK